VPKIEVVLSDTEYMFLYGVIKDTLRSLETFAPPPASDNNTLKSQLSLPPLPEPTEASNDALAAPAPPPSSTVTLQAQVVIHSAVLSLQLHQQPLAEFSINSVTVSFENGGRDGSAELVTKVNVEVANFLLVDKRVGKASPYYKYIVAPKNLDLTMLRVSFYEYPL